MSTKKGGRRSLRWLPWMIVIVAIGIFALYKVFGPNTGSPMQDEYLYIRTGSTYEQVKQTLDKGGYIRDINSFDLLARQAHYPDKVKAGKYKIDKGMSNYKIIRLLGSGQQTPVKLVINKLRTKNDLVTLLSKNLEADSNVLRQMFADEVYLSQFQLDTNTVLCCIVPDTYEFFWNTSADKTFKRLNKYYKDFWTEERKQKAAAKNLSQKQAIIIASIVDEETNKNDEKGNVASVYINRLNKNMKLQADPTVKYAVGDFTIRRITGAHLQSPSPYNTYMYAGLPPGPICTPSKKSIDAVLNAPDTNYIYFCAKEDFSGYHRFASSYAEHMKNAKLYQQALNARNIH